MLRTLIVHAISLAFVALAACAQLDGEAEVALLGRDVPQHWVVNTSFAEATQKTFSARGSEYIKVHFASFNLSLGGAVQVRDARGALIAQYIGLGRGGVGAQEGGFYSPRVEGSNVTVQFVPSPVHNPNLRGENGFVIDAIVKSALDVSERTFCGINNAQAAKCFVGSSLLPQAYTKSLAVPQLVIGHGACTGFLLGSEGHFMTAHHCVSNSTMAASMEVRFGFESAGCDTKCQSAKDYTTCYPAATPVQATYIAGNGSSGVDYALLKLSSTQNLAATFGYLRLRRAGAKEGENLYIPEHTNGFATVISAQDDDGTPLQAKFGSVQGYPNLITYRADTSGGSSGAPVLAASDNAVIAIHLAGGTTSDPCQNLGINSAAILADLAKQYVKLPASAVL